MAFVVLMPLSFGVVRGRRYLKAVGMVGLSGRLGPRPQSISTSCPRRDLVDAVDFADHASEPPAIDDRERLGAARKILLGKPGQPVDQLLSLGARVVARVNGLEHELERAPELVDALRFVTPFGAAQDRDGLIARHHPSS